MNYLDFIMNTRTIKETEIFSELAHTWWSESGPFKSLHAINPVRLHYMLSHIQNHPLGKSPSLLDIGCGGGLICEPFARLGYQVTGIDQSSEAIEAAQEHSASMNLAIQYHKITVEQVTNSYNVVCLLEILEHVDNPKLLLKVAANLLKPGGLLFFSTLNRTAFSYIAGIALAENVLQWAPKGTHQWERFLKPSEIGLPLKKAGVTIKDISGISWSIQSNSWELSKHLSGSYIGVGYKE